jgi:hypothetical protein
LKEEEEEKGEAAAAAVADNNSSSNRNNKSLLDCVKDNDVANLNRSVYKRTLPPL